MFIQIFIFCILLYRAYYKWLFLTWVLSLVFPSNFFTLFYLLSIIYFYLYLVFTCKYNLYWVKIKLQIYFPWTYTKLKIKEDNWRRVFFTLMSMKKEILLPKLFSKFIVIAFHIKQLCLITKVHLGLAIK